MKEQKNDFISFITIYFSIRRSTVSSFDTTKLQGTGGIVIIREKKKEEQQLNGTGGIVIVREKKKEN
ncbi:hypothetical protein [Pseudoalteromonas gelatinilytica]